MKNLHSKKSVSWLSAFVGLTAAGCAPADEAPLVTVASVKAGLTAPAGVDTADGCPGTRQVGILPPGRSRCPRPPNGDWKRTNLFPHSNSAALRQFCTYDWTGSGTPDTDTLPWGNSSWLEPECMSVSAFGHPYEARNVAAFEQAFLSQVRAVEVLPPGAVPTKVVVVDTSVDAPFPNGGTGRSKHGRAIATVIRKLACTSGMGGGCAAQVATALAMPLRRTPGGVITDTTRGGWLGRPSDIAEALHGGLHRALVRNGPGRIILNLSLGWDGAWGGAVTGGIASLPVGQQMVYSALEEAACNDALVIAAVGNAAGASSDGGPAFPGAWERRAAPAPHRCLDFGVTSHTRPPQAYRPLIYAASAVDGQDKRLPSQRPGSLTRLAAPGGHVAISDGGWSSQIYTGTSMSAAAVSAAAALVWGYSPTLPPYEVMDIVHRAGANLSRTPEMCLGGGSCFGQSTRRVTICGSVQQVCSLTGTCAPPLCLGRPAGQDDRPTGIDYSVPTGTSYLYQNATLFRPPSPCTNSVYAINPLNLDSACPVETYPTRYVAPFAVPQPPVIGCANCGIIPNGVEIGISDEVTGNLEDPVLSVTYDDGTEEQFALDNVGTLTGGDTVQVDVQQLNSANVDQASIEFTYDGSFSTLDDLHVEN